MGVFRMLKWNNDLTIGVVSIDNQHKELFNRINLLLESMKKQRGQDEILNMLNFLEDYVVKHFNEEEYIQEKNNYPGYEAQCVQHQEFKEGLLKLRKIIESDGIKASSVIIIQQKICNWWINHISKEDMDLGKFLCE